jgi:archaemetzincin
VKTFYVVAVGDVEAKALEWVETVATEWFPFPVARLKPLPVPAGSYDPRRAQYQSVEIMKALTRAAPPDTARLLGVTEADLGIPMLSFLFGQAQFDGQVALISLCRLRQEFYGLPPEDSLLRERATKETLHEVGHTFGLTHCFDAVCAMSLSTHIGLVDSKSGRYCARCGAHLARRFASSNGNGDSA